MKKSLLIICFALATTFSASADNIDKFLNKFDRFVTEVTAINDEELIGDKLEAIEQKFDTFIHDYHEKYSKKMTTEQVAQFNRIRGRYQKKMISAKAKRKGAAAKGFIEGLVESEK